MHHPDKPSILLVEDNAHTHRLVDLWLRQSFDLSITVHPDEALALAERKAFDLLMLDINLGRGHSGINLLATLRQRPAFTHTPAIAFTAYAMPDDRERLLNEGFDYYLSKPFNKQELLDVVQLALAGLRVTA